MKFEGRKVEKVIIETWSSEEVLVKDVLKILGNGQIEYHCEWLDDNESKKNLKINIENDKFFQMPLTALAMLISKQIENLDAEDGDINMYGHILSIEFDDGKIYERKLYGLPDSDIVELANDFIPAVFGVYWIDSYYDSLLYDDNIEESDDDYDSEDENNLEEADDDKINDFNNDYIA